jgi:2-hydroxychromene-2-carboxylate isomerase
VTETVFYYDFNSPYAYLSAHRIARGALPGEVRWQPVAFGVIIGEVGKVPWSLASPESAREGKAICERRAAELGLPPITWHPEWPAGNYSILVLRAALVAQEHGRLPEFSLAAYAQNFAAGADLREPDVVLEAAVAAGLEREAVAERVRDAEIKQRLRDVTAAAIADGITGVPTFDVAGRRYWGDDRIAAAASSAAAN